MFPKTGPIGTRSLCPGALAAGAFPGPGASEQQLRQKFPALDCAPRAKRDKAARVLAERVVSLNFGQIPGFARQGDVFRLWRRAY